MDQDKVPTKSEVRAICTYLQRWPEVTQSEFGHRFHGDTTDRREDAAAMLRFYLIERSVNFLDRYIPGRDRNAPEGVIVADLDAALRDPRGAFRVWVRSMNRWVFRDWCRKRRQCGEHLEVRVQADGADDGGIAFDRLAEAASEDSPTEDLEVDAARDAVARLMDEADPETQQDIAVYLAACEAENPADVFRAWGTSRASVVSRLSRLRVPAARAMREASGWAC